MILATWYKKKIKDSILSLVYVDKNKVAGVNTNDPQEKEHIYQQYIQAFKKGVYNFIKEEPNQTANQRIPRKYFSGGMSLTWNDWAMVIINELPASKSFNSDKAMIVSAGMVPNVPDGAINIGQNIQKAAQVLSTQEGNVVLEKNSSSGIWQLRRSSIPIEVPQSVVDRMGSLLNKEGKTRFLIALRNYDVKSIEQTLHSVFKENPRTLQDIFKASGIESFYKYKRVILVPPYGDDEGRPLTKSNIAPAFGVEMIAYALNRTLGDVDARVYNPNLTSPQDLYEFIKREKPDVIGKSFMETTFKKDIEIMSQMWLESPKSLFLVGGPNVAEAPHQDLFNSLHIDGIITGGIGSIVEIINAISLDATKEEQISQIHQAGNVLTLDTAGKVQPVLKKTELPVNLKNPYEDIPIGIVDVTHQKSYPRPDNTNLMPLSRGKVGVNPLRVTEEVIGNGCKGKCIFCPWKRLNTKQHLTPEEVIANIKKRYKPQVHDSIYFSFWDIFDDLPFIKRLAELLEADPVLRDVPKRASGRVDTIGDGSILDILKKAGFTYISFGVESYPMSAALRKVGKQTTVQQNIRAVEACLKAGLRVTLFQIFFSPGRTVKSFLNDIDHTLKYIEKGASICLAPSMDIFWGTAFSKMRRAHRLETYNFPGMRNPLLYSDRMKHDDEQMEVIEHRMMEIAEELLGDPRYPAFARNSFTFYGLILFKSFCLALQEVMPQEQKQTVTQKIRDIEILIYQVLDEEASTAKTLYSQELAGRFVHRKDLEIPTGLMGASNKEKILLEDGTLVYLTKDDVKSDLYYIYSVPKSQTIGEIQLKGNKIVSLKVGHVVDDTGFLQTALYQWARRAVFQTSTRSLVDELYTP